MRRGIRVRINADLGDLFAGVRDGGGGLEMMVVGGAFGGEPKGDEEEDEDESSADADADDDPHVKPEHDGALRELVGEEWRPVVRHCKGGVFLARLRSRLDLFELELQIIMLGSLVKVEKVNEREPTWMSSRMVAKV